MKRFLLAGIFLVSLCACAPAEKNETEIQYFRLASTQSENYLTNQACQLFCDLVAQRSDQTIVIEPYFNGSLGDAQEALERCLYGGVDFVRASALTAAPYAPTMKALQMPYEYTSDQHLFRVLDGEIGQQALKELQEVGLEGLVYFYAGYRCYFMVDQPMKSLDDMQGKRIRVGASGAMDLLVQQWGAEPVEVDNEDLALALRSGWVDGAEDNLPTYVDSGYYRLAPYWTYDRHTYNTDVLIASAQAMDALTEEEQQLIRECAAEAATWQREHWIHAEVRAMLHASRSGCYMALLDETETERFRKAAEPYYNTLTAAQKQVVEAVNAFADPEQGGKG